MSLRDIVNITTEDHPSLATSLERALIEEKEKQIEGLTSAKDWADFKGRNGTISGLNIAISICQQQNKRLKA